MHSLSFDPFAGWEREHNLLYSFTAEGFPCHLWLIQEVFLEGSCVEHLITNSWFTELLWKVGEALGDGPSLDEGDHWRVFIYRSCLVHDTFLSLYSQIVVMQRASASSCLLPWHPTWDQVTGTSRTMSQNESFLPKDLTIRYFVKAMKK